jgi:alpha-beta hydrolase superfamily lysophospholipase
MKQETFEFRASDGLRLFARYWIPESEPRAIICLQHGLAEHSGRYDELANLFFKENIAFYAADLRGHGQSSGKRGHTPSLNQLADDAESLLKEARKNNFDAPLFLYGHSTGGTVVAHYLTNRNTTELKGAILSSPWLELAFEPPAFKVMLAKVGSLLFPALTQDNELDASHLCHNHEIVQEYMNDPLVHHRISARLFLDCYKGGLAAIENAVHISIPTLVVHGTEDKITSHKGSEKFALKNPNHIKLELFPEQYHELHHEEVKDELFDKLLAFVEKNS